MSLSVCTATVTKRPATAGRFDVRVVDSTSRGIGKRAYRLQHSIDSWPADPFLGR